MEPIQLTCQQYSFGLCSAVECVFFVIFQTFLYVERAVISQQAREKIIFYNLTRFSPRSVLTMDSRNFPPNNNLDVTITVERLIPKAESV